MTWEVTEGLLQAVRKALGVENEEWLRDEEDVTTR